MKLTEEAYGLLKKAKQILASVNAFKRDAESLQPNTRETISIGLNTNGEVLKVEELLNIASEESPHLEFHFAKTRSEDILNDLKSSKIRAGFFYGNEVDRSIERIRLCSYKMVVVYPYNWETVPQNTTIVYFSQLPWIWTTKGCPFYKESIKYLESKNLKPHHVFHVDDELLVGQLVESNMGCSLLAEPVAEIFKREKKLKIWHNVDFEIDLNFGYLQIMKDDPPVVDVCSIINRIWKLG